MGGVEDHRRAGLGQDRQRAHVGDQRVVAERHAALGDEHVRIAGAEQLGHHVLHVPGREELALLDVDRLAGARRGHQQIGLAAEEGRDLQEVDRFGDRSAMLGLMHVGGDRKAGALFDLGEDGERLGESEPAGACRAGAVRLVERALIDEADLEPGGDFLQRLRHFQRMGPALQHARPGDQRERQIVAELRLFRRRRRPRARASWLRSWPDHETGRPKRQPAWRL